MKILLAGAHDMKTPSLLLLINTGSTLDHKRPVKSLKFKDVSLVRQVFESQASRGKTRLCLTFVLHICASLHQSSSGVL